MAIDKKLIHFNNKSSFNKKVENDEILDTSIVFIQDSQEIYTHGTEYQFVNWSTLWSSLIKTSDDKIFTAKDGEFLYNI